MGENDSMPLMKDPPSPPDRYSDPPPNPSKPRYECGDLNLIRKTRNENHKSQNISKHINIQEIHKDSLTPGDTHTHTIMQWNKQVNG